MPMRALRTTLRQKLQTTLGLLIAVVLGMATVVGWATVQWQRSEHGLREHYLRSLHLLDVRGGTYRALKELSDAAFASDPDAAAEFEQALGRVEEDFGRWAALAHDAVEKAQVQEVRASYDALIDHARHFFGLLAQNRRPDALRLLEEQIESVDLVRFDRLGTEATRSDEEYRAEIQRRSDANRRLAQLVLAVAVSATLALAALLGYVFFAGLLGPLREVEKALAALGRGELDRRIPDPRILRPVPVLSPNELASLTRAFNQTVDELSRTTVSKAYLDNVIESILDTVIVTTPEGIIRTVNPAAAELLEIPRQDLVGRSIAAFLGPVWTRLEDPQPAWDRDTEITMRSGRTLHVSLSRSVMRGTEGAVLGFVFVAKDMSERKRSEDELRAALAEKEVLFKEINHRVKNNLQIVSSLLNLHARQVLEPTAGEILRDSRKRIQAMALVHEMLYRTGTPSQLDLAAYLHSLAGHLMASHGTVTHRIQVQTTLDRPLTSLDVAIPCGLIVNELVTNSLKHGFPEGSPGEIVIELANSTKGHYRITVRDNGIGWPQRPTPIPPSSLGLRLVRSLAEQLGGSLRQSNENGARVDLEFPRTLPPG